MARSRHGLFLNGSNKQPPEYRALTNIKTRCLNPNATHYYRYGGRGVTICDRWRNGDGSLSAYECFLQDMGRRPSPEHSVERIDNNGHYEPGNCRWATRKEQSNNTRRNVTVEMNGTVYTMAAACDEFGLDYNHLHKRVTRKGWTLSQVIQEKNNDTVRR